jgi:hypothetical protein
MGQSGLASAVKSGLNTFGQTVISPTGSPEAITMARTMLIVFGLSTSMLISQIMSFGWKTLFWIPNWIKRIWKIRTVSSGSIQELDLPSKEIADYLHQGDEYKLEVDTMSYDPFDPDSGGRPIPKDIPFKFVSFVAAPRFTNNYWMMIQPSAGEASGGNRIIHLDVFPYIKLLDNKFLKDLKG